MSNPALPEDINRMLHEHDFGVLATYTGEYPYTSLISIDISIDGRYLVFPTLRETRKYANLLHEAHVSMLLDNRSLTEKNSAQVYALTVLGKAREIDAAMRSVHEKQFLRHHPHLAGFLSQQQTALFQVTFAKLILVEEFQKVREFDCQQQ
jgi:nitroimidazol reductase NimA-like FMN-containing flavoprotein (pyridoxamine 5'-phosphate oxidase superfamily)